MFLSARPWVWLSSGAVALAAMAPLLSWLTYDGLTERSRTPVPDVIAQVLLLVGWLALLFAAFRHGGEGLARIMALGARLHDRHGRLVTSAFVAIIALLLIVTAVVTLHAFPNSADENVAVFQAETLAAGRLWNDLPPHPEAFYSHHILMKDGKWVGKYPPGWPAVMAAGTALGLPAWAVNPLLGTVSLVVFYALCRRLGPAPMALAATAILGGSAFFVFNSASFFNHCLVTLGGLLFVLFALRFQESADWRDGLVAGAALGLVGLTRHLEAVLFVLPFLLSFAWHGPHRGSRLSIVWLGMGGLPFLAALLLYYGSITGDPLLPAMQWDNPVDTIKFFSANPQAHGSFRGLQIIALNLIEWAQWNSPMILLLYGLALVVKAYRRQLRFFDFYLLLFVIAYFFYWGTGGNRYGPRYYYPALPFVILTILTAAQMLVRDEVVGRFRPLVPFALASTLLVMVAQIPLWSLRMHAMVEERRDLYRQVAERDLDHAVVFLTNGTGAIRRMSRGDLTRNGVDPEARSVLYLRDLGERNGEVMALFSGREFWIYRREDDEPEGTLEPYAGPSDG